MYIKKLTLEHSYGKVTSGCQQMNIFPSSEDAISGFLLKNKDFVQYL